MTINMGKKKNTFNKEDYKTGGPLANLTIDSILNSQKLAQKAAENAKDKETVIELKDESEDDIKSKIKMSSSKKKGGNKKKKSKSNSKIKIMKEVEIEGTGKNTRENALDYLESTNEGTLPESISEELVFGTPFSKSEKQEQEDISIQKTEADTIEEMERKAPGYNKIQKDKKMKETIKEKELSYNLEKSADAIAKTTATNKEMSFEEKEEAIDSLTKELKKVEKIKEDYDKDLKESKRISDEIYKLTKQNDPFYPLMNKKLQKLANKTYEMIQDQEEQSRGYTERIITDREDDQEWIKEYKQLKNQEEKFGETSVGERKIREEKLKNWRDAALWTAGGLTAGALAGYTTPLLAGMLYLNEGMGVGIGIQKGYENLIKQHNLFNMDMTDPYNVTAAQSIADGLALMTDIGGEYAAWKLGQEGLEGLMRAGLKKGYKKVNNIQEEVGKNIKRINNKTKTEIKNYEEYLKSTKPGFIDFKKKNALLGGKKGKAGTFELQTGYGEKLIEGKTDIMSTLLRKKIGQTYKKTFKKNKFDISIDDLRKAHNKTAKDIEDAEYLPEKAKTRYKDKLEEFHNNIEKKFQEYKNTRQSFLSGEKKIVAKTNKKQEIDRTVRETGDMLENYQKIFQNSEISDMSADIIKRIKEIKNKFNNTISILDKQNKTKEFFDVLSSLDKKGQITFDNLNKIMDLKTFNEVNLKNLPANPSKKANSLKNQVAKELRYILKGQQDIAEETGKWTPKKLLDKQLEDRVYGSRITSENKAVNENGNPPLVKKTKVDEGDLEDLFKAQKEYEKKKVFAEKADDNFKIAKKEDYKNLIGKEIDDIKNNDDIVLIDESYKTGNDTDKEYFNYHEEKNTQEVLNNREATEMKEIVEDGVLSKEKILANAIDNKVMKTQLGTKNLKKSLDNLQDNSSKQIPLENGAGNWRYSLDKGSFYLKPNNKFSPSKTFSKYIISDSHNKTHTSLLLEGNYLGREQGAVSDLISDLSKSYNEVEIEAMDIFKKIEKVLSNNNKQLIKRMNNKTFFENKFEIEVKSPETGRKVKHSISENNLFQLYGVLNSSNIGKRIPESKFAIDFSYKTKDKAGLFKRKVERDVFRIDNSNIKDLTKQVNNKLNKSYKNLLKEYQREFQKMGKVFDETTTLNISNYFPTRMIFKKGMPAYKVDDLPTDPTQYFNLQERFSDLSIDLDGPFWGNAKNHIKSIVSGKHSSLLKKAKSFISPQNPSMNVLKYMLDDSPDIKFGKNIENKYQTAMAETILETQGRNIAKNEDFEGSLLAGLLSYLKKYTIVNILGGALGIGVKQLGSTAVDMIEHPLGTPKALKHFARSLVSKVDFTSSTPYQPSEDAILSPSINARFKSMNFLNVDRAEKVMGGTDKLKQKAANLHSKAEEILLAHIRLFDNLAVKKTAGDVKGDLIKKWNLDKNKFKNITQKMRKAEELTKDENLILREFRKEFNFRSNVSHPNYGSDKNFGALQYKLNDEGKFVHGGPMSTFYNYASMFSTAIRAMTNNISRHSFGAKRAFQKGNYKDMAENFLKASLQMGVPTGVMAGVNVKRSELRDRKAKTQYPIMSEFLYQSVFNNPVLTQSLVARLGAKQTIQKALGVRGYWYGTGFPTSEITNVQRDFQTFINGIEEIFDTQEEADKFSEQLFSKGIFNYHKIFSNDSISKEEWGWIDESLKMISKTTISGSNLAKVSLENYASWFALMLNSTQFKEGKNRNIKKFLKLYEKHFNDWYKSKEEEQEKVIESPNSSTIKDMILGAGVSSNLWSYKTYKKLREKNIKYLFNKSVKKLTPWGYQKEEEKSEKKDIEIDKSIESNKEISSDKEISLEGKK